MKSTQKQTAIQVVDTLIAEAQKYHHQESFENAIKSNLEALRKLEVIKANTKSVSPEIIEEYFAKIHYQIALNHFDYYRTRQSYLEEAEKHCNKILETKYKGNIVDVYELLGKICIKQKRFDEALKFYNEMKAAIAEEESLETVHAYNLKADIYLERAKLNQDYDERKKEKDLASKYYQDARRITRNLKMEGDTIETANYWRKRGDTAELGGYQEAVIGCYQDAIAVLRKIAPNSSDLGFCLRRLAYGHFRKKQYEESLKACTEALTIYQDKPHPIDTSVIRYQLAISAFELGLYDLALEHAETIMKDGIDEHHYLGCHIKSKVMTVFAEDKSINPSLSAKKKKLESALDLISKALKPNPKDPSMRYEKFLIEISLAETQKALGEAIDSKTLREHASALQASSKSSKIQLSSEIGQLSTVEYKLEEALKRISDLDTTVAHHETRLTTAEQKLDVLEDRMNKLEEKLYKLEDAIGIINQALSDISAKEKEANGNQALLDKLLQERQKIEERKSLILEFNRNDDTRHFFFALLSEMEAAYIASKAVQSRQIDITSNMRGGKAAMLAKASHYISQLTGLIPVVGNAASKLVSVVGLVAISYDSAFRTVELERIAEMATTIEEFDQIALRVAVKLTVENQDKIRALNGAATDTNWQKSLKLAIKKDLETAMAEFIRKNDTQAKLAGRTIAHEVIGRVLQKEGVAESLRFMSEKDTGEPTRKTRPSVVADEIIIELKKLRDKPANSVSKPTNGGNGCCVVM